MHRCVRCAATYEDNDSSILRGCAKCGSIFFLYIKQPEDVKQVDATIQAVEQELQKQDTTLEKELTKEIKKRKELVRKKKKVVRKPKKRVAKRVEIEKEREEEIEEPIAKMRKDVIKVGKTKFAVEDIFGIETIRMPRDGVYEINIDALMKKKPIIVLESGNVYFIHLPSAFDVAE